MLKKIGALWGRNGKKGKFISGELTITSELVKNGKVNFLAFKNQYKEKETQPDYNVYISDDQTDPPKQATIDEAKKQFGPKNDEIPF